MVAPRPGRPHPGLALAGALVRPAGWLYWSAAVKTRTPLTRTPGVGPGVSPGATGRSEDDREIQDQTGRVRTTKGWCEMPTTTWLAMTRREAADEPDV